MKRNFKNWVTIMALTGMALITMANIQHQSTISKLDTQYKQLITDYTEYQNITDNQIYELEQLLIPYLDVTYNQIHWDMYNHVIEYHENGNQDYANEVDIDNYLWDTLALLGYDMTFNGLID